MQLNIFKNKTLIIITALMLLGLVATSTSSYYFARQHAIEHLSEKDLPLTSDGIYSEIQRDLLSPKIISSTMANDTFVKDWLLNNEQDQEAINRYLANIKTEYDTFTAFLVSDKTKNYYYADGILKQVSHYDPRDNWYYRVRGSDKNSELNVDKSQAHNDALTIFMNYKIFGYDGELLGITGVGLNSEHVQGVLQHYREKYDNEVFFIKPNGSIIIYDKQSAVFKGNIKQIEGLSNLETEILSQKHDNTVQTFTYQTNNRTFVLNTRFIKELELTLAIISDVGQTTSQNKQKPWFDIIIWLLVTLGVLAAMISILNRMQTKLQNTAWQDDLTGILNRAGFSQRYQEVEKDFVRNNNNFSVLLIDIDHFKKVNDELGHANGDKALKLSVDIINQIIRPTDILARWGGEEFVLLLPNTQASLACNLAERLRIEISLSEELRNLLGRPLTVSIGLTQHKEGLSMDQNLATADKHLYKAKNSGRNKVGWLGGIL